MLLSKIRDAACRARRSAHNRRRTLVRDNSGLALTEFAFAAPFLLVVGMLGIETVNFIIVHQKASQIAMLTADSASRKLERMDELDIEEIFYGAHVSGDSINLAENGRVVLTMLTDNGRVGGTNGNWVRWQRCYGGLGEEENLQSDYGEEGDGENNSSLAAGIGPSHNKVKAFVGGPVNFVEVFVDYEPLIGNGITDRLYKDTRIHYTAALMVRERSDQSIANQTFLSSSDTWTCNRYDTIAGL